MTPRKKIHATDADRMRATRERRRAQGMQQLTVWLSGPAVEKLDRLADAKGLDRNGLLEALVMKAKTSSRK